MNIAAAHETYIVLYISNAFLVEGGHYVSDALTKPKVCFPSCALWEIPRAQSL